jgi:hypothetical protein
VILRTRIQCTISFKYFQVNDKYVINNHLQDTAYVKAILLYAVNRILVQL